MLEIGAYFQHLASSFDRDWLLENFQSDRFLSHSPNFPTIFILRQLPQIQIIGNLTLEIIEQSFFDWLNLIIQSTQIEKDL